MWRRGGSGIYQVREVPEQVQSLSGIDVVPTAPGVARTSAGDLTSSVHRSVFVSHLQTSDWKPVFRQSDESFEDYRKQFTTYKMLLVCDFIIRATANAVTMNDKSSEPEPESLAASSSPKQRKWEETKITANEQNFLSKSEKSFPEISISSNFTVQSDWKTA